MQKYKITDNAKKGAKSALFIMQSAVIAIAALLPMFTAGQASAAQLTARSATLDNSKVSATGVGIVFAYNLPTTASALQGIVYDFCTAPLGTCIQPTGMVVNASTHVAQSGFPANGTAFATRTGADLGACLSTSQTYQRCFIRTDATTGGGAVTHSIGAVTAPSSKQTVYIRIGVYSDANYATLVDSGTVAVAFVDQLVTNGRVQERLDFCVASIDAAATLPTTLALCSALNSASIDIGIIDNTIAVSPVASTSTNGSNNKYGILMADTNASGGLLVSYYPEVAGSGTNQLRDFRVTGATCNASNANLLDQCFQEASNTGSTFTGGTEMFGLQVPCIDTSNGTTTSLGSVPAAYSNTDNNTTSAANCQNLGVDAGVKFAFNNSGTAATLASSTTVVDKETVKVRFGATASATTPTGAYTITTTYIATPTF